MTKKIVIVPLGGFNNKQKQLSIISIQRLEKCVELIQKYKTDNIKIILSGGLGNHFNPTNEPHSLICEKYLIQQLNVNKKYISYGTTNLFTKITNTVEEAISLYNEMMSTESIFFSANLIIIVTSPYHLERSKYLIEKAYNKVVCDKRAKLLFVPCKPIPISDNSDDNIDFLNPKIPKTKQKDLWKYYMNDFSKEQKESLNLYENIGLYTLKNNPYGMWLEFLNNNVGRQKSACRNFL